MFDLGLTDAEKAEFLEAARLAGDWLVNTQCTPRQPWGPVAAADSADCGRYLEKCSPARDYRKPAGVWLQGLALCGLIDLACTPLLDRQRYRDSIETGARFLRSLQCFDVRWTGAIGGFHEVGPGRSYSAPRDAATGAMGLIALHVEFGQAEDLDRALRFAQWYSTHGSDADGYPWDDFELESGQGASRLRGDWQAGGALVYYQLWRLTGLDRWRAALVRVLDVLERICRDAPSTDTAYDFHGHCVLSVGNDDFANTALMAGFQATGDARYLKLACDRLCAELARQAPSGTFPGYGGTFVTALELIEALDLSAGGVEVLPVHGLRGPLLKAARFALTLQERSSPDRWMLGGVYGQSNYATARDTVHARDTNYALQLFLRMSGRRAGAYTTLGWDPPACAAVRSEQ